MIETETVETALHRDALASTQQELIVSTATLSDRFIDPPPGKLYLLYGAREVFHLSLFVASKILGHPDLSGPVALVDGANRFDPYYLARVLRGQYGDARPFLKNIYVSRGFTCYQMEAAITQRLPQFLRKMESKTAMIFGLLDTFYDEQARFQEVQRSLERIMKRLHEMKKEGVSILIVALEMKVLPEERNQLFRSLKTSADRVYRLEVRKDYCQLLLESTQMESVAKLKKENHYGPYRPDLHIPRSRRSILVGKIPTGAEERGSRNLR